MASNHIGHSSPLHDEKMKSLDASHVIYAQKMKEING
jgi:hypothetical protein